MPPSSSRPFSMERTGTEAGLARALLPAPCARPGGLAGTWEGQRAAQQQLQNENGLQLKAGGPCGGQDELLVGPGARPGRAGGWQDRAQHPVSPDLRPLLHCARPHCRGAGAGRAGGRFQKGGLGGPPAVTKLLRVSCEGYFSEWGGRPGRRGSGPFRESLFLLSHRVRGLQSHCRRCADSAFQALAPQSPWALLAQDAA